MIRQLWRGEAQAFGEVALAAETAVEAANLSDAPLAAGWLPSGDGCGASGRGRRGPVPADRHWSAYAVPPTWRALLEPCHGTVGAGEICRADVRVFDAEGALVAELRDVQFKRATRNVLERLGERWLDDCLYETHWRPAPLSRREANAERSHGCAA